MTNYYNSLCIGRDTVHKKSKFGASGGSPNTTKTSRWWLASLFMVMSLFMGQLSFGQIALPYSETFAGITVANGFPTVTGGAWTRSGTTTNQPTYITNTGSYNQSGNGDTKYICHRYNTGTRYYFVGPFSLTAGVSYTSSCLYKADGSTGFGPLALTYGTTAAAATQTNTIASVPADIVNGSFNTLSGAFTPATSGNYYLSIKCTANGNPWYLTVDDFKLNITPTCFTPTALAVSSITTSSASVTWTAPASGTAPANYEYEVRTSGAAGSGATGLAFSGNPTTNSASLTGLSANTPYSVYVRSFCGGSDYSDWTIASSFATPCIASILPLTEGFNTAATIPSCWAQQFVSGSLAFTFPTAGTGTPAPAAQEGSRLVMYNSYSNSAKTRLVSTPVSTTGISSVDVNFQWYHYNVGPLSSYPTEGVTLQYSTDGTTWTSVGSQIPRYNATTGWSLKTATLPVGAANQPVLYIGFLFEGNAGYDSYLDNVNVKSTPNCIVPSTLSASSITNNAATLTWTAPSTGTPPVGYEYVVSTTNTAPTGAGTSNSVTSVSISSLTANTTYYAFVRTSCGSGDFSEWTPASSFKTACDPISSFSETFDAVTTPALPSCWSSIIRGATVSTFATVTTSTTNFSTPNGVAIYNSSSTSTDDLILVSPSLSNLGAGTYQLRFFARNGTAGENIQVGTLNNNSSTATFTPFQTVTLSSSFAEYTVSFAGYIGSDTNIGFRKTNGTAYTYVYIDNVTWEPLPTCFKPTSVTASAITYNSATISWTAPTSGSPVSYEYVVSTSNTTPTGSGTVNAGTSVGVSGLTANTAYYAFVRTFCGGSDYSVWTLATSFFTGYCVPTGGTSSTSYYLNSVSTTGGLTNFTQATSTYGAYNDYNASTSCSQYDGSSVTINLASAGGSTYYYYCWIDWNNDLDFADAGETVLATTSYTANGTATVNIPLGKAPGDYRMRVANSWSGALVPCGPAPYGSYQDYKLNVQAAPICAGTPNNGTVTIGSAIGCSGVATTLTATGLTSGYTGISYQWQSSPDDSNWTDISGANAATYSLITLAGLTYYRVNTTCADSSTTSNSNSVSYTGTMCTYNTAYSTGATYSSIMSTGTTYSGWQGTTSGDDNVTTTQALTGTTFKFQGQPVTGFQACTNGWMTFNTSNTSNTWTNALGGSSPTKVLAPFWDDMVLTGADFANRNACMRYQVTGTLGSGSAVITIEWAGMEKFSAAGPNINFQVKLHESDNHIEYVYGNFEAFDGTLGATTSSPNSLYSYSIGYNGANPSGTGASDRFALQTPNANHFSATSDPANHNIMPVCFSQFTLTPGTYSGLTSAPVAVVPSNDDAVGAISITATSAPVTSYCGTYFTSKNATDSGAGLPTCTTVAATAGSQDDDVWFKFTTSSISDYTIKVRPSGYYDAVVQLLDTSFTPISCSNSATGGFTETVNATGLTTGGAIYYVRVFHNGANVGTSSGEFSIAVNEVINPPTNDNIAGATLLSSSSLTCSATSSEYPATLSATASVTTPTVTCGTADDDVWYYFVASSASQIVSVQSGTGYNAAFTVYSSSDNTDLASASAGTLTVAGSCQNNTSTAGLESYSAATFVPGNYYFVRVYHAATGTGSGNFTICVTSVLAPNCTTLTTPVDGATGVAIGTVALAWTAPSADATHSAAASYDVYTGTTSGALTLFTNTTNTTVNLTGVTYGTYYVRIVPKNAGGSAVGGCTETSFTTIPDPCAGITPSGDTFATAIDLGTLTNTGVIVTGNNYASNCYRDDYTATSTIGDALARPGRDVFYKFVVTDTCNTVDIGTCVSSFDTYLQLLDSTGTRITGDDFSCPGANANNGALITISSLAPGVYYAVVEGYYSYSEGTYTLDIAYTGSAQNTYYVDADGDNYGNSALPTVLGCTKPTGYALLDGDCDDNNPARNPGLAEVLYNGIDDNCDGQLDEGFEKTTVLNSSSCSANLAFIYNSINAEIKSGVTGYRFEVTNLTNPLAPVQTIDRTVQWFTLTQLASYDYSTTYSIKVMLRVGTTWLGYYGDACTVSTPDVSSPTGGSAVVVSPVCGTKLPTVSSHNIYTNLISGVTGYKYRVTRGTEVQELVKTTHWFRLNQLPNYVYGATYTVEVAFKTTGDYTPYGPACTILAPDAPTITTCGQTTVSGNIYSALLYGVTQYTFEVTNLTNTSEAVQVINRPNHYLPVSLITGYSSANMYSIRVAVTSTGIQSDYGTACEINVPAPTKLSDGNLTSEFKANGFPNPFTNNFTLDITTTSEEKVSVMVYDMIGKLLDRVEVNATDNALELGANYPAGVYNVIVSQGEKVESVRMVKR